MAMNDYSDNDYWKALAERFFEAGTSEEEERELRRFIASGLAGSEFNDVRAVMGLAAVGARRYHRRRRRTVFLSAAALLVVVQADYGLSAVVAVVMTAVSLAADGGDSCVAYINGTKHTDEAIVMAQMHSTMDEMAQQAQELSVERQMDDFFVESFNN